jgi:hypothetical protein
VIVVGGLLLMSCGGGDSSDDDAATSEITEPVAVDAEGFPQGLYGAGLESGMVAFGAYTEFYADGTGRVRGPVGNSSATLRLHDSEFTYVIDGDQIEVTATMGDCEAGASGTYRLSTDVTALGLADPVDACADRSVVLHGDWSSLGDTPVIEIDPGGAPVTIDSPIGPIAWQVVEGQAYVWERSDSRTEDFNRPHPVVAIEGGFVAVVDEQSGTADRALVFSQNGVDWQSIPPPPPSVGLIATNGEALYAVPAMAPDAVYVTVDRGGTWTAIEIEDRPASVSGLYAGPAGVLLTSDGPSLWLLDDASFEKVATPAPFVQVLVLDSGFFALSVEGTGENAPKSYWLSGDGRTWTEATDVPTGIYDRDTTNWGDNVYLSNWGNAIGYTSTDGGRTWIPTMRPGEGLTVTEAGYFTVQPGIFGTPVGVVWVSSDDTDWQRVVNPVPPPWTSPPIISGNTILIPSDINPSFGEPARLDLVGSIN